ncbi:MAG: hypothetical protein VB078_04320 [Clostridiaceae bacterium]|nr:hypothetical protein [Clostridiaceae bacterium]
MDKKKLLFVFTVLFGLLTVGGVAYIAYMRGKTSGAFAFIPAVATILAFNAYRSEGSGKK